MLHESTVVSGLWEADIIKAEINTKRVSLSRRLWGVDENWWTWAT